MSLMEVIINFGRQSLYEITLPNKNDKYMHLFNNKTNTFLIHFIQQNFIPLKLSPKMHNRQQGQFIQETQFNRNRDHQSLLQQSYPTRSNTNANKMDYSFTRKPKSYKKHYPNNLHELSQLKFLGLVVPPPKLQTKHDKLDITDIIGASPNHYRNQIFKNRIYGKQMNRRHIFSTENGSQCPLLQNRNSPKSDLRKLQTQQIALRRPYVSYENDKYANKPIKLNIDHVMDMRYNAVPKELNLQKRRRIKTDLDNPQYYTKQEGNSRQLRKWNPTNLSSNNNSFLFKLEPIK